SPSMVALAPLGTASVTVTFTVTNPKLLTKTIDPTVSPTAGDLPREFQADASGRVVLTPTAPTTGPALRVPVYSAPRPASNMYQASSLTFSGGAVQTKQLSLLGTGVDQGSGPSQVLSTVSGFELLGESGVAPTCADTASTLCAHFPDERSADLKYVGSTSDVPQLNAMGYTN